VGFLLRRRFVFNCSPTYARHPLFLNPKNTILPENTERARTCTH
jgi:hypothetical protein